MSPPSSSLVGMIKPRAYSDEQVAIEIFMSNNLALKFMEEKTNASSSHNEGEEYIRSIDEEDAVNHRRLSFE